MKKSNFRTIILTLIGIAGISINICAQETGSFTDNRDATVYKTIKIGEQWWMSENLAYKSNSGCSTYEDIEDYVKTYGYFYNWETANNVCPEGWHLPSYAEFQKLSNHLGGDDVAGGKLKVTGTDHWNSPNAGATNSSGFSALPSGRGGPDAYKAYTGLMTFFWTSEDEGEEDGICKALYSAKEEFTVYGVKKNEPYSVRCIKDQ